VNGAGRGDLYAEITVQLPRDLSRREKELFAELAASSAQGSTATSHSTAASA